MNHVPLPNAIKAIKSALKGSKMCNKEMRDKLLKYAFV